MTPAAPPLAFVFANLAMLGWLAAAAAPILIHLWMRQTRRETPWAAVRFLRAALERQARKLRLQHWVLLAVRTTLLVLLALAAAKPVFEGTLLGGGIPTHRVLVIDASLSMSSIDESGRSQLERARDIANQLVNAAGPGDTHSLVVMGADSGTPLARPVADAVSVARAIDAVAASQGVADLEQGFAAIGRVLDEASATAASPRGEVIFLTDLGANTWSPLAGEAPANRLSSGLAKLLERATVSLFDVTGPPMANAAVSAVALAGGPPTLADPIEVRAEARLWSGEPGDRIVELLLDGTVIAERRVTLAPGQVTPLEFTHRLSRPGVAELAVRLTPPPGVADRLSADDTRRAALVVKPRLKVLCVAGSPRAAAYLADALDPSGDGVFEPVVVSDADLPGIDLGDYACVLLSNVRELTPTEADRLRRYAERGGGVGWFLGDRVDPDRYNETLGPPRVERVPSAMTPSNLRLVSSDNPTPGPEAEAATGPGQTTEALIPGWLSASVASASYRIDPRGYSHPVVRPFEGQERAGLLNTPVLRRLPLELAPGGDAVVALALESGDPLLVTASLGRGRVAVLTTAASIEVIDAATSQPWTALPAWPSFLPIVRGLVNYLSPASDATSLSIGAPIEGIVGDPSAAAAVAIGVPDEEPGRARTVRVLPDETGAWSYRDTRSAGVYRFGPEGGPAAGGVAVNVDPAEGDPAKVSPGRLPEGIVLRGAGGPSDQSADTASTTPIHRWLLYGALVLALVEPVIACRFGRGNA